MIIDVSEHQGVIAWGTAKDHIDAAILRLGYGSDLEKQDDKQWIYNVAECERYKIPYGVYLYSYAKDEAHIDSEIKHTLRLLQNHTPQLPVFFDSEQKGTEGVSRAFALKFCETIKAAGYKAGIYCSENWWNNFIKDFPDEYPRWIAKYGVNDGAQHSVPNVPNVSIWQYTSKASVPGINGRVDANVKMEEVSINPTPAPAPQPTKSIDEIAHEVIDGKWAAGDERKNLLSKAGYDYNTVQARVNEILTPAKKSIDQIAQEVINNRWGSGDDRKNRLTVAGYDYNAVQAKVNDILKPKKTIDQIASEVIAGQWGMGDDRKNKLARAGYDYNAVQARVNQILGAGSSTPAKKSIDQIAREVIAGKWGTNPARKQKLTQAGYDYNAVQARVNQLMK